MHSKLAGSVDQNEYCRSVGIAEEARLRQGSWVHGDASTDQTAKIFARGGLGGDADE